MQDVYANYSQKHCMHCMSKTEPIKKKELFLSGENKRKTQNTSFPLFFLPWSLCQHVNQSDSSHFLILLMSLPFTRPQVEPFSFCALLHLILTKRFCCFLTTKCSPASIFSCSSKCSRIRIIFHFYLGCCYDLWSRLVSSPDSLKSTPPKSLL